MGLTNTHLVYSPEKDKVLLFVPNGNPDKARAIDRTNEFLHSIVAMAMNHGGSFQVNLRGKSYLFGMQDVTVEAEPEEQSEVSEVKDGE